jgi:ATP-binding cassette subfamily C protein CydD
LPYKGSLTVNGIEIAVMNRTSWLSAISWLGQNPKLIHGSIDANLRLAKPDATEHELWHALNCAHAAEFIHPLEQQLDYRIGDRAGGLSVGQAQRIALARTLLKDAQLLVLDEPTASLDSHSEKLVQKALNKARQQKTTIWISHNENQLELGDHTLTMAVEGSVND